MLPCQVSIMRLTIAWFQIQNSAKGLMQALHSTSIPTEHKAFMAEMGRNPPKSSSGFEVWKKKKRSLVRLFIGH
ncbi:hypothetical protein JTE90_002840 [Oedothorax gibbosus]|uniref:Uncharacterized protein n=1 Tax=Oedothorax gibbosus TaxID=931172 RepID=A0AAV6UI39_9ARAC|nr:hypothetical protein JTE90_002840 [Oedothorax gibbosus]